MFGFDLTLILGGIAAALGVVVRVLWGQKKKAEREAKVAKREVRRRVLVQEADRQTKSDLQEIEREIDREERDELIDDLVNR